MHGNLDIKGTIVTSHLSYSSGLVLFAYILRTAQLSARFRGILG
jgi:hypothetical protein